MTLRAFTGSSRDAIHSYLINVANYYAEGAALRALEDLEGPRICSAHLAGATLIVTCSAGENHAEATRGAAADYVIRQLSSTQTPNFVTVRIADESISVQPDVIRTWLSRWEFAFPVAVSLFGGSDLDAALGGDELQVSFPKRLGTLCGFPSAGEGS